MTAEEWVERFAREAGAEVPSSEDIDAVLRIAATAAHASERTAAPVACWIAGKTGKSLAELEGLAERIEPS